MVAEKHQESVPVVESKTCASLVLGYGSHLVKKLPNSNVDDAVTFGICQHQDCGGHWDLDAMQAFQMFELPPLTSGLEDLNSSTFDGICGVASNLPDRTRRFPPADLDEFRFREISAAARGRQITYELLSLEIFLG